MDRIDTYVEDVLALLVSRHQQTNNEAIVRAFAKQCQLIENAIYQLFTEQYLDNAAGVNLDNIGAIVGQPRRLLSDENYRRLIRVRVLVQNSEGTLPEIVSIVKLFLNDDAISVRIVDEPPHHVTVYVDDSLTDSDANTLLSLLQDSVVGSVRVHLRYYEDGASEDNMFTLGGLSNINGSHFIGNTTLNVTNTTGFPDTGSLMLSHGSSEYEVVTYSAKTLTTFTISALTKDHIDFLNNTVIEYSDTEGLSDGDPATIGGKYSTVISS